MPWLSEDVPGWDEMTEDERDAFRRAVEDLGMTIDEDDEDGYYE